jgi:hypothetical protein
LLCLNISAANGYTAIIGIRSGQTKNLWDDEATGNSSGQSSGR